MTPNESADSAPKRPRVPWKLIIAAATVWSGEIYHTRPGHQRASFSSIETFCEAVIELTGWPLHVALDRHSSPTPDGQARVRTRGRGLRVSLEDPRPDSRPPGGKIVLAADSPWSGELYLTRPGLAKIPFTSFEEFFVGVIQITGWPISQPRTARAS